MSRAPVGVWGAAWVLEGLGEFMLGPAARNLVTNARIPNIKNAVYCFEAHSVADVGHREDARRRLRSLTDKRDRDAVIFVARATIETWGSLGHDVWCRLPARR